MAELMCPYCHRPLVEVDNPMRRELRHRRGEEAACPGPPAEQQDAPVRGFLSGLVWPARLSDVGPTSRARLMQADPDRYFAQARREAAEGTRRERPARGGVIAEAGRLTSARPLFGDERLDVLVMALAPTYGLDAASLVPADPVLRFIRDHARQVAERLDELGVTLQRGATS